MMKSAIGMGCVLVLAVLSAWAEDFRFDSVGVRYGFSGAGETRGLQQTEAFVDWKLPWALDFKYDFTLQPELGFSAGWLKQYHADAFIGGFGPSLMFSKNEFPLVFVAGVNANWLTRTTFETKEFGTPLQFTEHVGVQLRPGSHFLLGYRFQHISNCSLSHFNSGLNLHMFSMGYVF